jgi:gamma-glutamyltranspeptidase/glutathione hydrolase
MVATAEPLATRAGLDVLREGGNAVDAAVAVAFALAVTFPNAGNLGGGGFMLVRRRGGAAVAVDYRETAPAAAGRDVYLDATGNPKTGEGSSLAGYRASGVPGTVAGMHHALTRYGSGRVSWARAIEPARRLAADGFAVPANLVSSINAKREWLSRYPESKRVYLAGGAGLRAGQRWRQPELAETLGRLQKRGPQDFYAGETARRIADDMRRNGGLITAADLKGYRVKERTPLTGAYRGHKVVTMPPPSSGGVALLQMLGMLEAFDLRALGAESPERYHLLIEAMRRAFADRAEYLGDPDFVSVPVAQLLDPVYVARRRDTISREKASTSDSVRAGDLGQVADGSWETTHFTVVDGAGNAVSNTYTLNGSYGSAVTIAGTGVLMNNEMDDFAVKPGVPNQFGLIQSARNAVGPRRRPLSSMTPTFVLTPDGGRVLLAVGSPGGPTIINTVLQVVLNVLDHGRDVAEAVAAPRLHHQWLPDEVTADRGFPAAAARALEAKGHRFGPARKLGDAQAVLLDPETGALTGASDPRGHGAALGY